MGRIGVEAKYIETIRLGEAVMKSRPFRSDLHVRYPYSHRGIYNASHVANLAALLVAMQLSCITLWLFSIDQGISSRFSRI